MTRAHRWLWPLGGLLFTVAAAACADMANSSMDRASSGPSDAAPSAPGKGFESADLGPTDNGIILVHAAGFPSFRLCFKGDLNRAPIPDSQLMPEANIVGVEVGSAVRIDPLTTPPGEVFLFSEPLIRVHFPPGKSSLQTCKTLLDTDGIPSTRIGNISKDLSKGVHLLVVSGCAPKTALRSYTKEECGETYTDQAGNLTITEQELKGSTRTSPTELPAQLVHLSRPLETLRGTRKLSVSFGDITSPTTVHTSIAEAPELGGTPTNFVSAPTFNATDIGTYAKFGLRVALKEADGGVADGGGVLSEQSMADIQLLSAPRDVPTTYYAAASNYVFLLLGDPAPKLDDGGLDDDERRRLHLLAVPVILNADGGTDGGGNASTSDGG